MEMSWNLQKNVSHKLHRLYDPFLETHMLMLQISSGNVPLIIIHESIHTACCIQKNIYSKRWLSGPATAYVGKVWEKSTFVFGATKTVILPPLEGQ